MADDTSTTTETTKTSPAHAAASDGNSATTGDHDRVAMLSLRADGTPDQTNPEFIGDPAQTLAATKEQFVQQAVSAADVAARTTPPAEVEQAEQDPSVVALQEAHDSATTAAETAAEKVVEGLAS